MHRDPGRRRTPLAALRGSVVGVVTASVAVAGHALGGGSTPAAPVAVVVAAVVAGCVLASARAWTLARTAAALVGAQLAVHGALWLVAPSSSADPRLAALTGTAGHEGHVHAAAAAPMLLAHALATVVAGVLLVLVDRAVLVLAVLLRRLVLRLGAVQVPALRRPVPPALDIPLVGPGPRGRVRRRGPPVRLAAA